MEIKVINDTQNQECDVLVVNKFEGENTTSEIANTYAVQEDNFEGKLGETYVLPTYGQEKHRKVLAIGIHTMAGGSHEIPSCRLEMWWVYFLFLINIRIPNERAR